MQCLACGYTLDGLPAFRCPECGRGFDPNDRASYGPPAGRALTDAEARWLIQLYWLFLGVAAGLVGPYLHYALAWLVLGREPPRLVSIPRSSRGSGGCAMCSWCGSSGQCQAMAAVTIPVVVAFKSEPNTPARWWLVRATVPLAGILMFIALRGRVVTWFAG